MATAVQDTGSPDSRIMIVAECPSRKDEEKGRLFSDSAGKLLKGMLKHSGIDFNNCYVTCVSPDRPPASDFTYLYEDSKKRVPKKSLEEKWIRIQDKIERLNPDICFLLGTEALRAVTNKTSIKNWRGIFLKYKNTKCMCTYTPSSVMKQFDIHPIVEMDFSKGVNRSPKSDPLITIKPTIGQVIEKLDKLTANQPVAYDIESVGKMIRCIAFAWFNENKQIESICIPLIRFQSSNMVGIKTNIINLSTSSSGCSYWSTDEEVLVLDSMSRVFNTCKMYGQNSISFDEPFQSKHLGLDVPEKNQYFDLMHAWHLCYCEFPKSLAFICSVLTDYDNYWTNKTTELDESEWYYNCMDTVITLEAGLKVEQELLDMDLSAVYFDIVHPLALLMAKVQDYGMLIDIEKRESLIVEYKEKARLALEYINETAGKKVNPNSPKQIKELLYDTMKLPAIYKGDKVTTDENAIRKLLKRYPNELILRSIIDYRKATKLVSTFLEVNLDSDNRIRTSYNVSGTKFGRLASSQNIWGEGMNLQNIPAGRGQGIANIRDLFIVAKDCLYCKSDLTQAETMYVARILKRLGFPQLWEKYEDPNFDIHTWMASLIFNKPESEIVKYERSIGKLANHSGNYMAGPKVLQANAMKWGITNIDFKESQRILSLRTKAIAGLTTWWYDVEKKLKKTRIIENCFGRKMIFFNRAEGETIRNAVSAEPQSGVGDLLSQIAIKLSKVLPDDCHILGSVYDEVDLEIPEFRKHEVAKLIHECSLIPMFIDPDDSPLIIPMEINFGPNWKDVEEYKI